MNELNSTNPVRTAVTAAVRADAEPVSTPEPLAAGTVPQAGNALPETSRPAEADHRALETAAAVRAQVEKAVAAINEYARKSLRNLEFSMDSELDRPIVQVIDASTREVIRQIPTETALAVARNLQSSIDQLNLQRAARQAGVDGFVSADASLGLVNTHA